MNISTIIIDDDKDSRFITRSFLTKHYPQIVIAAEAGSVEEGIREITTHHPDLLFLDIAMPDGTAFDLLKQIPNKNFEVIFITAYEAFAIEAFKFSAIGYLLKPAATDDLKEAINKAEDRIRKNLFEVHWLALSHNLQHVNSYDKKLAIPTASGYVFVNVRDIIRCVSNNNYTEFFFTDGKKMTSSHNLGFYEDFLPAEKFCRIHHSNLINVDYIDKYQKRTNGGTVIMKDGTELDVSQRRKDTLFEHVLRKQR